MESQTAQSALGAAQSSVELGNSVHIHKPKPLHSVREFLSEIGVIVVGVLIALGLEQSIESLHWRHRVEQTELLLRLEARENASQGRQYQALKPCADAYLERLQSDLLKHDSTDIARLYEFGTPFLSVPWKVSAWESAVASQISDHMPSERFLAYGNVFRAANLLRDIQLQLRDDYAVAMTGRHPLPPDTKTLADELTAMERLRTNIIVGRRVSGDLIETADRLGVVPDPDLLAESKRMAEKCVAVVGQPSK